MNASPSFVETVDAIGRSDFRGTYHGSDYGRSHVKQAERERVLDYVLSVARQQDDAAFIKLLSFPGLDWTFEQMLLLEHPRAQIVGLERSFSAYARSRRVMPLGPRDRGEEGRHLQDRSIAYGTGSVTYSRIAANRPGRGKCGKRPTRSNRLLLMEFATYVTMLTTDYGATLSQKREFHEKFWGRNAAWLDFTGTLCSSLEESLRQLPLCFDHGEHPLVLTLRNGRDLFQGVDARLRRISTVLPGFTIDDHWTYLGKAGSSMLTICGRLQ